LDRKTEENIISDLDIMSNIIFECTGDGSVAGHDGCTHLEIWVLLDKVSKDSAQHSVIAID
jgi:hypothetical protein